MKFRLFAVIVPLFSLLANPVVYAQAPASPQAADINALRAQLDALKAEYEKRIQALEKQVEDLQTQMLRAEPEAVAPAPAPAVVPTSPGVLNPAISVVGNFLGRADNRKVLLDDGVTRIDDQLNLREAEVDMRVPIDPYADGVLITSLESEKPGEFSASVEEGYVNIKKLPFAESPLGLKFQVGQIGRAHV